MQPRESPPDRPALVAAAQKPHNDNQRFARSKSEGGSHHADAATICDDYARRGRRAGDGAFEHGPCAGRPPPDHRRAGPSLESQVAGLEVGARSCTPVAGAVHDRAAGADDGRGRRRSRGDRSAVLARRPQRLCPRSREALSKSFPRDGAHSAAGPEIGGVVAEMEGAAGNGGRSPHLQQFHQHPVAHRRHGRLVLAGRGKGGASGHVLCDPASEKCSVPSRSVTPSSPSSSIT